MHSLNLGTAVGKGIVAKPIYPPAIRGTLSAEATVFRKGRSLVIADCLVTDDHGKAVSRATSTFLIRQV